VLGDTEGPVVVNVVGEFPKSQEYTTELLGVLTLVFVKLTDSGINPRYGFAIKDALIVSRITVFVAVAVQPLTEFIAVTV
jgi:hypothetical protein